MRLLKLAVVAFLTPTLALPFVFTPAEGRRQAAEAPAAFDNQTNGFTDQTTFDADRLAFEEQEQIADGTGQTRISSSFSSRDLTPAWSPDSGENVRTFRASLNVLGDGIVDAVAEATRNKVRTAPLWGLRTRDRLMHDGGSSSPPSNSGAQSFTINEAILRHAGEAAAVKNSYLALTEMQKRQLIRFLKSL